MGWVSATWTRTIITILVTWVVLFMIKVGKEQGWYPEDPSWHPCSAGLSTREPCVMGDGRLSIIHNGQRIIYPREER